MNLIHGVGAGLIVLGGFLPSSAQADWPLGGCGQCDHAAPMAPMAPMFAPPMFAPQMQAAPMCGGPLWGPRMRGHRMPRHQVYRTRTRTRTRTFSSGPAMFGGAAMGSSIGDCGCSSPEMIIPQTMMRPQQITTYVDVPKTVMRQEAVQVQVPTTTYRQVAVDEGSFQQVWVPRMVTKNVPQTVMQTQVQYRQVPQTVMERVPQITTQMVHSQIGHQYSPTIIGSPMGQSFALNGQAYPIATPTTVTPIDEATPSPINPVPTPLNESATLPRFAPQTSQVQDWQKVRQRPSTIQQQAYEVESIETGYRVPQAAGRFSSKR